MVSKASRGDGAHDLNHSDGLQSYFPVPRASGTSEATSLGRSHIRLQRRLSYTSNFRHHGLRPTLALASCGHISPYLNEPHKGATETIDGRKTKISNSDLESPKRHRCSSHNSGEKKAYR